MEMKNVVSYFDGISCGQVALEKVGIKPINYFAYEIDKYAKKVTQENYPNTKQMGSVLDVDFDTLPKIDLLIGGSPCQGFSFAGKQLNFEDPRSKLFFEFVKALKALNPKYWLLENVKMKKEYQDIISGYLGVEPIKINSKKYTGQNRERLYWTNINYKASEEKDILLIFDENLFNKVNIVPFVKKKINLFAELPTFFNPYNSSELKYSPTLQAQGNRQTNSCSIFYQDGIDFYMANSDYWEELQGLPKKYTYGYSENIRKTLIGNGWTVDVVCDFFKNLPRN